MQRERWLAACITAAALIHLPILPLRAANPERDFSGQWCLDAAGSNVSALGMEPERMLTVTQDEQRLRCATGSAQWTYALSGGESQYRLGAENLNSVAKWEGAALLINTLVSGPRDYSMMDRWRLSADRTALTITRQVNQGGVESEGWMLYRRDAPGAPSPVAANTLAESPRQPLARREEPEPPPAITIPSG